MLSDGTVRIPRMFWYVGLRDRVFQFGYVLQHFLEKFIIYYPPIQYSFGLSIGVIDFFARDVKVFPSLISIFIYYHSAIFRLVSSICLLKVS